MPATNHTDADRTPDPIGPDPEPRDWRYIGMKLQRTGEVGVLVFWGCEVWSCRLGKSYAAPSHPFSANDRVTPTHTTRNTHTQHATHTHTH